MDSDRDQTSMPTLDLSLYEDLRATVKGPIYLRGHPEFHHYSCVFNGNVKSLAKAVVLPVNTEDVSKILIFCGKHSLSPSIKAGGYGTSGWAIAGDIIVDLTKLTGVDIESPQPGGTFTSLRDMPFFGDKGKNKLGPLVGDTSFVNNSGKRRREEEEQEQEEEEQEREGEAGEVKIEMVEEGAELHIYDAASRAVGQFLRGDSFRESTMDGPSPNIRRRLNDSPYSSMASDSASDAQQYSPMHSASSTLDTSPSPPASAENRSTHLSLNGDPFGYITEGNTTSPYHQEPLYTVTPQYMNLTEPGLLFNQNPGSAPSLVNSSLPPAPHDPVTRALPIHPHGYVTFGAGMKQKEIDVYTAQNPLEARCLSGSPSKIPYHVPFSAHPVGSSVMLLGGFGFLSRLHGLSIDNLVEVEMVLADGRIVIVNNDNYPDLWWALRGAGTAFGVATRYKARAYPVPVVFAGNLIYRFHPATAPSLIKHFRDCVKGAPRELYANVILTAGPAGKDSLVVIQMCYVGRREKGQEFLAAISSWEGEQCLLNEVDEKSFLHQQDSVAQVLRGKAGNQWYIRSALIDSLPDDIIHETVLKFADSPVGCTWLFELAGGAIVEFEDNCFPKAKREAPFTVAALHQWPMDLDDPRCIESAEEWISGTLHPVSVGNPFPSFLARHESTTRIMSCYGDNWARLREIKNRYDPNGLFRNAMWPLGPDGELVEPRIHEPPTP